MRGVLTIIPVSGAVSSKELTAPPRLQDLQAGIGGGSIKVVPGFKEYEDEPCVVFCDEDGKRKRLPGNSRATALWFIQGSDWRPSGDVLVGPIVIITGDADLMEEL